METYRNPVLASLPAHLRQFVVPQNYARYSAIDQAVWRYVMRQNYAYLKEVAYYPYIPGLRKAGLSIERIPNLQAMNDSLSQIGWGAVTVDGFIPPSAFMEFQAHRVLVIAADIRQLEHIEYTPAPDIIHESSGHAPIIGEPEYAAYLQYFGEIGSKAMFSAQDFQLYEAIRHLSILKERSDVTKEELNAAEAALVDVQQHMGEPSEMALLSRLHWWTVEYGLIGTVEDPKIYGAGLLSSIGESASCMQPAVPKLDYTINALDYSYDITTAQPQLFVTPDFKHLRTILDEFADTMAFRVGGKYGMNLAIDSGNTCTVVYSSGLQVSGTFQQIGREDVLTYIRTIGPTALAIEDQQLRGHSKAQHADGFGSPVGAVAGWDVALEDCVPQELSDRGWLVGQIVEIQFESGIVVRGQLLDQIFHESKLCLLSFTDCNVQDNNSGEIYFEPSWGRYDMAVGENIISVYFGSADKSAFESKISVSQHKTNIVPENEDRKLHIQLYATIRALREENKAIDLQQFLQEHEFLLSQNWLALVELLELAMDSSQTDAASRIEKKLGTLSAKDASLKKLIADGIRLAKDQETEILL
ncbi:aromatic amino acid hydroxylase [Sphingobacterium corticibacter]|uniref:Aromatic amino acid hydroxylase n=1 Tax=Sphingobacterium corticibacter TaxID=2171749 RepID=A0A2T8HM79_9SPHI|nr:aromatic amino acid hydroxylase [Sphingobacterium corticibacter]PVH26513.1 aromatic amino acid hydroxylase [Sphingobacterium corticibacter]